VCLGIPGQLVEWVDEDNHIAKAAVSGVRRNVSVALLSDGPDEVGLGDWVLIHVGFAMSRVDEEEARSTLAFLSQLGAPFDEEMADLRSSEIE